MGKRRDEPPKQQPDRASPFAALASLRGSLPPGEESTTQPPAGSPANPLAAKLVLQRERKGRGGKTVTALRGVALEGEALAEFARELRHALGTGGGVEQDVIVLAGDQVERASAWLRERGAARVVIGN